MNQYQQPQMQQQQNYMNLLVINAFEDVEKYIVMANQTVNFYDNKNGYIFVKSADSIGKYSIKAFKLNEVDINNIGKQNDTPTKYVQISDLNAVNERVDILSAQLQKLITTQNKGEINDDKQ
jgi:hypothetical protein